MLLSVFFANKNKLQKDCRIIKITFLYHAAIAISIYPCTIYLDPSKHLIHLLPVQLNPLPADHTSNTLYSIHINTPVPLYNKPHRFLHLSSRSSSLSSCPFLVLPFVPLPCLCYYYTLSSRLAYVAITQTLGGPFHLKLS